MLHALPRLRLAHAPTPLVQPGRLANGSYDSREWGELQIGRAHV